MHKSIRELIDVFGLKNAMVIVKKWPKRRVRIPVKVDDFDPLALVLGHELARNLVAFKGGEYLDLPDERDALMEMRNELIWELCIEQGRSMTSVAIELGLSRPGVADILRRVRDLKDLREAVIKTARGEA